MVTEGVCRGGRERVGVWVCLGGEEGWGVYVRWCCVLASATAPPTALPTQLWGISGEPLATPEIRPSAARLSMDQCWSAGDRIRWVGRETLAAKMDTVRPARGGSSQAPACARHCCRAEKTECQRCGNRKEAGWGTRAIGEPTAEADATQPPEARDGARMGITKQEKKTKKRRARKGKGGRGRGRRRKFIRVFRAFL